MNVQVNPFTLEGCQCRLKWDPKILQEWLHQRLQERVAKSAKHLDPVGGELVIDGSFTEIYEGNFALHMMLAFLGKARLVCQVKAAHDGRVILDETLTASATCAWFTPGKSQLKVDTKVIANQVVKKTINALRD